MVLGNCTDDNSFSLKKSKIKDLKKKKKKKLLVDFTTAINWFFGNDMIINPDHCKYMC